MTRTIASQNIQEEEDDDAEDVAGGTDTSSHREGKSVEQKPKKYRSKHSETEQRRRSKINERFQILRDLIPPNDQKRDKASLLLEVIEYIQFLQEKIQVYEGPYEQVWHQDTAKLIPWRANHGPVDNFVNHSQVLTSGPMDENNIVQSMAGTQGSEFSEDFAYRGVDNPAEPTAPAVTFNNPLQSCSCPPGRSFLPTNNLASPHHLSTIAECNVTGNEGGAFESSSSNISDAYSQGVLQKLTQALQTSGVDLSQANISVQLDVGKGEGSSSIAAAASSAGGVHNQSPSRQFGSHSMDVSANKRLRTGES